MPPPETYKKVKSGVSLRCARSILVHTSHYSRLVIPFATQERRPRVYYTFFSTYHYPYARQTQVNWKKETTEKKRREREGKERKEKYV